jgi:hypothetical protein
MLKLVWSASNVGKVPTPVYFKHILASQLLCYKTSDTKLSSITQFFDHILMVGYFPTVWKSAKVIPIPKPGKPPFISGSYTPISRFV